MPARLDPPAHKHDIRLFDEDAEFLTGYLARHNSTLNEFVRDLVHRAAVEKRRALGLFPPS